MRARTPWLRLAARLSGLLSLASIPACAPGGGPGWAAETDAETDSLATAPSALVAIHQEELDPGDATRGDAFGRAVALSGDTALVGASWAQGDEDEGAAYVFVEDGSWDKQAKLLPQHPSPYAFFGASVALSSDANVALVGAPGATSKDVTGADVVTGSAHVFVRNGETWQEEAVLFAPDGADQDAFGDSVLLSGDTAFIGADRDDGDAGAVYVFTRSGSGWSYRSKITPADGAPGSRFGGVMSISGDTLAVTAQAAYQQGARTGVAYVFVRDGSDWALQAKLVPPPEIGQSSFGRSVAVSGDTLVIGASWADVFGKDAGAAYVFVRSEGAWSQPELLGPSDVEPGDQFGCSAALDGDRMLIGACRQDEIKEDAGAVYVFDRSGGVWKEEAKLTLIGGSSGDNLGFAVALRRETILAGALFANSWALESGAAHVFRVLLEPGRPCDEADVCASGHCVEGVCCDEACSGEGLHCTAETKGWGEDGVCASRPEKRSLYSCEAASGEASSRALAAAIVFLALVAHRRRRRAA